MKHFIRLILLVFVSFVAWKAYLFLFPSDETRIQRKLTRLESLVSYNSGTSPLSHLSAANRLQEMFTQDASLNIRAESNTWNLNGRGEIRTAILSTRQQEPGGMTVSITDPIFEHSSDTQITTLVTVRAEFGSAGTQLVRILEMEWIVGERSQWQIQKIKTRQDLEWGN